MSVALAAKEYPPVTANGCKRTLRLPPLPSFKNPTGPGMVTAATGLWKCSGNQAICVRGSRRQRWLRPSVFLNLVRNVVAAASSFVVGDRPRVILNAC